MDKKALLKQLELMVTSDLSVLTQAALAAHEAATHAESKAEDQYDTRGLEASYLAGAQSKRALELEELLNIFRHIDILSFGPESPIAATAVVEVETEGKRFHYLFMPRGGGTSTTFDGKLVSVITPQSPLGGALLGHRVGDHVEVEIQKVRRGYDVISVF